MRRLANDLTPSSEYKIAISSTQLGIKGRYLPQIWMYSPDLRPVVAMAPMSNPVQSLLLKQIGRRRRLLSSLFGTGGGWYPRGIGDRILLFASHLR